MKVVFLNPGEWFVGDSTHEVHTLLGSCVSITLWDPVLHVGAMSHFLLTAGAVRAPVRRDGRYAEGAMALMLEGLARRGVPASRCQAKIFGGGHMFPAQPRSGPVDVGRRNGEAARRLLRAQGIEVRAESLFGAGHRNIVFEIATGNVWARQVRPPGVGAQ
ncbi:chemotaxis protein CheD [Ideonella sp. BN130291]|uniref:chemotaxis protein CheD n=1 Tax=Ideonella sp. BN130291 TaxID=3112940 RepID=UPI002E260431|nr:chemotaxis protein CheD [Ideonella sp. BN130291]